MPTYDYRCPRCEHRFELFHAITDDKPKRCPRCRARARRVPAGGAGLLFKGSGFYVTDYRSKSYREKAKQEKSGEGGGSSGSAEASGRRSSPKGASAAGKPAGKPAPKGD